MIIGERRDFPRRITFPYKRGGYILSVLKNLFHYYHVDLFYTWLGKDWFYWEINWVLDEYTKLISYLGHFDQSTSPPSLKNGSLAIWTLPPQRPPPPRFWCTPSNQFFSMFQMIWSKKTNSFLVQNGKNFLTLRGSFLTFSKKKKEKFY